MHPEILSLSLFMFVTSCSPGPNNIVASHSGFNHGIKKTIPLMLGVIFGFTTMIAIVNFGLINLFDERSLETSLSDPGLFYFIFSFVLIIMSIRSIKKDQAIISSSNRLR